jgi:large subunit ribosomal protein L28
MARCAITGKRALKANNVSHANNRTRKWQKPNIQNKKVWIPELSKYVRLPLSARSIKTLNRVGLLEFAKMKGLDIRKLAS